MIVGIDARTIVGSRRGFGRLRHLLLAFLNRPEGHSFRLFAPSDKHIKGWPMPEGSKWESPRWRLRMLHRNGAGWIGRQLFRNIDVFFFPTADIWYSHYAPSVVTLHDLAPLHYPERFFENQTLFDRYRKHLEKIATVADRIATVSDFSRKDILENLDVEPDRVRTIYQGFADLSRSEKTRMSMKTLSKLDLSTPYFLYCGGLDFRKNVDGLIRAFANYRHELKGDRRLIIAGQIYVGNLKMFPDLVRCTREAEVIDEITITGWVDDGTLVELYRRADAFVYPSLFEGFGYAPLEAMAAGAPVLCSNATSLPEVVGDSALMAQADDPVEFAQGMKRIATDESLRQTLIEKGRANLKRFNWENTARQFISLFEEVVANRS